MCFAVIAVGNFVAWAWTLTEFAGQPVLLGTAVLAYGLSLRNSRYARLDERA